jgi:hypothetical protein
MKRAIAKLKISSLNSHFPHLKLQHKMLEAGRKGQTVEYDIHASSKSVRALGINDYLDSVTATGFIWTKSILAHDQVSTLLSRSNKTVKRRV